MDKQKMDIKQNFPLVEAMLLTPPESERGCVGVCTNTSAPGQIINDIDQKYREYVSVLGSLIVNRDGAERMIINSVVHQTLKYLILFSEESVTFTPSTNLLQAIMHGFEEEKKGNYIKNGLAASAHYPNIPQKIFDLFKKEIIVIPIFMSKGGKNKEIIFEYLEWLKPNISNELYELLIKINKQDKIYFDSLNKTLEKTISSSKNINKTKIELDSKDFQHLQPPKIELESLTTKFNTQFKVSRQNKNIRLDIQVDNKNYFIIGDNPFIIAYSLMKFIGDKKENISPLEQMLLGAELGRIKTEISNEIKFDSFILKNDIKGEDEILLEPIPKLIIDKKYYYKINIRGSKISAMCLSFDICDEVFELLSDKLPAIIEKIAKENRFEKYEMDFLHRVDVGIQLGRAAIAANFGFAFIQDFDAIFKINKETLPSIIVDGDSFLSVHKNLLLEIYTKGITEAHGDPWKGTARSASVLAIFRDTPNSLQKMPNIYKQGDQDPALIRENYKKELLRFDHDGTYTYGERTRSYFGFDQLEKIKKVLKNDPNHAATIQRFDPIKDMTPYLEEGSGKQKFTHDPCLTHDIFFILNNKIHSFHIARAHNTVNAYPENIFGLFDAYVNEIKKNLGLENGDMYMLSNRANILLLTEEQRTKKIINEPSKPIGEIDNVSGPYILGGNIKLPGISGAVAYYRGTLNTEKVKPTHSSLKKIESYKGINILEKAINYLKLRGNMHNNPIITDYYAGTDDPQSDQLVFLQSNVFGNKIYTTAVFSNHPLTKLEDDKRFVNYISTKFANNLSVGLGEMNIYYVAYKL